MPPEVWNDRYLGKEPAWHRLGTVFSEPITAIEALHRCRLDYLVEKIPLWMQDLTVMGTSLEQWPGKFGIVRLPTEDDPVRRPLGVVGADYQPIQNHQIAKNVDILTDVYPVETCGALEEGRIIFFVLDAGEVFIKGELVHAYFTVADFKGGGRALKILYTPVRIVCKNTLVSGIAQAMVNANIAHFATADVDMKFRFELLAKLQKSMGSTNALFLRMANVILSNSQVDEIITAAFPYPPKPKKVAAYEELTQESDLIAQYGSELEAGRVTQEKWEGVLHRQDEYRSTARMMFGRFNDEFPHVAQSAWAAVNSIAECADHREGADSVNESAMFGDRAKEKMRAFRAAITMI
jgi:hypothetical protein